MNYQCQTCGGDHSAAEACSNLPKVSFGADMEYTGPLKEIEYEAARGRDIWGAFNSAHEGFGVLLEEVDELKAHVWSKQPNRDLKAMRKEAMQVAAMALRFMTEVCDEARGRR